MRILLPINLRLNLLTCNIFIFFSLLFLSCNLHYRNEQENKTSPSPTQSKLIISAFGKGSDEDLLNNDKSNEFELKVSESEILDVLSSSIRIQDESNFSAHDPILIWDMASKVYSVHLITSVDKNFLTLNPIINNFHELKKGMKVYRFVQPSQKALESLTNEVSFPKWDGSRGGVLPIAINFEMRSEIKINASGTGFRGGNDYNLNGEGENSGVAGTPGGAVPFHPHAHTWCTYSGGGGGGGGGSGSFITKGLDGENAEAGQNRQVHQGRGYGGSLGVAGSIQNFVNDNFKMSFGGGGGSGGSGGSSSGNDSHHCNSGGHGGHGGKNGGQGGGIIFVLSQYETLLRLKSNGALGDPGSGGSNGSCSWGGECGGRGGSGRKAGDGAGGSIIFHSPQKFECEENQILSLGNGGKGFCKWVQFPPQ